MKEHIACKARLDTPRPRLYDPGMANDGIDVGQRVRVCREAQGMSLRELARRTDLTPQFLSQVELGQANTSIGSLRRIADALKVNLYYFLRDDDVLAPPQAVPVVRAGHRARLGSPDSAVEYELLTPDLTRKMEIICGVVKPGSGNVVRHTGVVTEEWIYVLSGALAVRLGEEEYVLYPGDAIYFDGERLRSIECASPEDARWISVITPPAL
jgi:transcriptional regulator with XRE-family HTH domain